MGNRGFEYQRLHTYDSFTGPNNLKYAYLENVPSVPIRGCRRDMESWEYLKANIHYALKCLLLENPFIKAIYSNYILI